VVNAIQAMLIKTGDGEKTVARGSRCCDQPCPACLPSLQLNHSAAAFAAQ